MGPRIARAPARVARRFWCVTTTPFGFPVEPEVNIITAHVVGVGGGRRIFGNVATSAEILEQHDLDAGRSRRNGGVSVCFGNQVIGVDDSLEGRHVFQLGEQGCDRSAVANYRRDFAVLHCLDYCFSTESGVDCSNDDRLREAPLGCDHPFSTRVFKDCQGARRGKLIQGCFVCSRDYAHAPERSTKFVGKRTHFTVSSPIDIRAKLLDTSVFVLDKVTSTHASIVGVQTKSTL